MKVKEIKNKSDLTQWVKEQINIDLLNDETNTLNKKRKILYTQFPRHKDGIVLSLLAKYKIRTEKHINDNYWIFLPKGVM